MPTDEQRPARLRLADIVKRQAAVLADLADHGPSTIRDMGVRMNPVMSEKLLRQTLEGLAGAGQVVVESRRFGRKEDEKSRPFRLGYRAKVYSLPPRGS